MVNIIKKDGTIEPLDRQKIINAVKKADLIIFSSGSLITSIMPNIIVPEIQKAIQEAKAQKLYICNMLTQPGETDDFKVSDHIKFIEKYIGDGQINAVIANNSKITKNMKVGVKFRYRQPDHPAIINLVDNEIVCEYDYYKAVTPGQEAVFYNEDGLLIASGTIDEVYRDKSRIDK